MHFRTDIQVVGCKEVHSVRGTQPQMRLAGISCHASRSACRGSLRNVDKGCSSLLREFDEATMNGKLWRSVDFLLFHRLFSFYLQSYDFSIPGVICSTPLICLLYLYTAFFEIRQVTIIDRVHLPSPYPCLESHNSRTSAYQI